MLRDLYYVSKNSNINAKTRKKIKNLLIRFIPSRALHISNLQAIKLLHKEQNLRNEVRKN